MSVLGFAVLTALGARFGVLGEVIPFTLQTPAVLLAGSFLGPARGALSQVLYLAAGAVGLPVFANPPHGGLEYFTGPTAGYLLAFPIAACLVGVLLRRRKSPLPRWLWATLSFGAGMALILAVGMLGLWALGDVTFTEAFDTGLVALVPGSAGKLVLVIVVFLVCSRGTDPPVQPFARV